MIIDQYLDERFSIYNADCVEVTSSIPDESVDFSIFSPPFASLYTYSNSELDMGNSRSYEEFFVHFGFLAEQLFRITKPGRVVAFHCMNIPAMKERDGYIGIKDFRGDLIRCFEKFGMIYHSEHCIWKDPLVEATRTKAIGLMHKQLVKDSAMSRSGLPDYMIAMRKPGENNNPIQHPDGLIPFYGENAPTAGTISHENWRRYASPVWMDIRQSDTLQGDSAREDQDERHICPLQLDVIRRGMHLWSNQDDVVLSPFMGIGSEGVIALEMGRKFIGIELKTSYYKQAKANILIEKDKKSEQDLLKV